MFFGVVPRVAIELGRRVISIAVLAVRAGRKKERTTGLECYRHNAAQQQLVEDAGIKACKGTFLFGEVKLSCLCNNSLKPYEPIEVFLVVKLCIRMEVSICLDLVLAHSLEIVLAKRLHKGGAIHAFYIAQMFFELLSRFVSGQVLFGCVCKSVTKADDCRQLIIE